MEFGDASGTGLLNVLAPGTGYTKLCAFIDNRLSEILPPVGSSLSVHGELRADLRSAWGLAPGIVVSAGGGDNMMGAIGTGNVIPGIVTASFGTSGTLYSCAAGPVIDPNGEVAAFCDSTDRWLPLVYAMNVTVITEHVRAMFGWSHDDLERAVLSAPAGAAGLTFLP